MTAASSTAAVATVTALCLTLCSFISHHSHVLTYSLVTGLKMSATNNCDLVHHFTTLWTICFTRSIQLSLQRHAICWQSAVTNSNLLAISFVSNVAQENDLRSIVHRKNWQRCCWQHWVSHCMSKQMSTSCLDYTTAKAFRPISFTYLLLKGLEKLVDRYLQDGRLARHPVHPQRSACQCLVSQLKVHFIN